MTPQLSKVVERLVKGMMEPHLERVCAFGENQFAYRKERGSRDLILMLMLEWLIILDNRGKIGVYNSDVAGAFDRVDPEILIAKLRSHGLHERIIAVLKSWLERRIATVVVGGSNSEQYVIENQVYQGTVLGPIQWDVHFEDVHVPVRNSHFKEVLFADDLNSYKGYDSTTSNKLIIKQCKKCQTEIHKWGDAKRITFEPAKESMSIISNHEPEGPDFKLMGIWFDTGLSMRRGITDLCNSLRWKLTTLLRTRHLFDTPTLIIQFKSRILSYVEHRTAAIYHPDATLIKLIDNQFDRFLLQAGITRANALTNYLFAPLNARRDMAMLGGIHRSMLRKGAAQIYE